MAMKPRGGNRKARNPEKDLKALKLRSEGYSYEQISEELGYNFRSGAYQAVQRALEWSYREPTDEARHLALIELDSLEREAWAIYRRAHYAHSAGKLVTNPITGEPILDSRPNLEAIDRLLDIQQRRAKLLGLDAPSKARVEVVTEDAIDAEIKRLSHEIEQQEAMLAAASEDDQG